MSLVHKVDCLMFCNSEIRASSGEQASKSLQDLSHDTGLPPLCLGEISQFFVFDYVKDYRSSVLYGSSSFPFLSVLDAPVSSAAWKLHYYQWAMQIFEQYNFNEGAYQFALAALEQVDEATSPRDGSDIEHPRDESSVSVKGRLWANVFKFTLDLNHFYDAYCAIISNPDEESKQICLRRFIIVLYERGAMKVYLLYCYSCTCFIPPVHDQCLI